jgi:Xaa-Pro aminopeptidase
MPARGLRENLQGRNVTVNILQRPSVPMFSLAERDRRWNMARAFMEREDLNALLVFGEHEDAGPAPFCLDTWFTNDRPGATVIFPRDGAPVMCVPGGIYALDHIEAIRRGDGIWIGPEGFRLGRHSSKIISAIRELGLEKGRIGVMGLEPYIPYQPEGVIPHNTWKNILDQLPDVGFVTVGNAFTRLMMPMSAEQVIVVSHCATIGEAMAQAMVETARPGISEAEVYAAAMAVAHKSGTHTPGMHFWSGRSHAAAGPPQWAYRAQPPRILEDGDFISSEVFCRLGMHDTQHQVAIAIGTVRDEIERAGEVARACYEGGMKAARVGSPFKQVGEAMLAPLEAAGGYVRGPQVHGMNPFGSLCRVPRTPGQIPGAEKYPDFPGYTHLCGDMLLEPGMCFAFEPSCGFGSHLITIGGTVIMGEDEAIELNPFTARLLRAGGR